MQADQIKIALAGNPNSGKTTIFNSITGARQHVGNYPGVTVEKKEGSTVYDGHELNVVDLPGIYSLTAYSIEELVARHFIIDEKPDVVINVIDASNLERNLYLTVQLIELGAPLVLAFNMSDVADHRGMQFDLELLSKLLGAPIVLTVGHKKKGQDELLETAIKVARKEITYPPVSISYGKRINRLLDGIEALVKSDAGFAGRRPARWVALKLLENDCRAFAHVKSSALAQAVREGIEFIQKVAGDNPETVIAERRYGFISGACQEAVRSSVEARHDVSDRIDAVLTNRVLALPIFLALMWLMFKFTFVASEPLVHWIELGFEALGEAIGRVLPGEGAIKSLLIDGIIGGVGGVLVFVPIIGLLFLFMAVLEATGYMARAAFIMDRYMHKVGLHGQSFIPMILGFGCTVPGIMACRVIPDRRDRLVTILVTPFMSCGARLPIYGLFIGAFFAESGGTVLFALYATGILVALLSARILRKFVLKGDASPLVMELPPYRMPTVRGILLQTWEQVRMYIRKAGTIILLGSVLMWFLSSFPWQRSYSSDYEAQIASAQELYYGDPASLGAAVKHIEGREHAERLEGSYAGRLGRALEPLIRPLGFTWRIGVALIGGLVAKEVVVSTLGTLYSVSDAGEEPQSLRERLQNARRPDGRKVYTPLVAFTLMVFSLLYLPCVAALAMIRKETGTWKWPLFTLAYTTGVAWVVSFLVHQLGSVLGIGVG
ncbi:MAG: ferrous iron transport protein B [Candidatus Coatesbacteria bacterium]|nr:ferrous iron transport protein B [Candidatus Coatesbacteria bacterium]